MQDYRQIQMLRFGGHSQTRQGGTFTKVVLSGTAWVSGEVVNRYCLGIGFSSTETTDLLFLNGTQFEAQWRNIAAGAYCWNFLGVTPHSDIGTALTCICDSPNGTVSMNLFYD